MKLVLWISFYFLTFLALITGLYMKREKVLEKTSEIPVLNYTRFHHDAQVADSSYTEEIDSLAVVVEGMLSEMTEYVSQLKDRDFKISKLEFEVKKLAQEKKDLQASIDASEKRKESYSRAQQEKKLVALAKMLGGMKGETLSPILSNLPDKLIQIFYDKAKAKDRAKIFNSLPPDRAGKILTDMTGNRK